MYHEKAELTGKINSTGKVESIRRRGQLTLGSVDFIKEATVFNSMAVNDSTF